MIKINLLKKSVQQLIEKKEAFHVYGFSDKLQIPHCLKLGCVTMTDLRDNHDNFNYLETYFSEQTIYIIRLRNVHDKWESGYITELMNFESDRDKKGIMGEHEVKSFNDDDENTNIIRNFLTEVHRIKEEKSFDWMNSMHSNVNDFGIENTLLYHEDERSLHDEENVFFIELKDLSNPKFLDWIKEKDSNWKVVKSIPHKNRTSKLLKKSVRLFWDEYKTDESLFNPYLFEPLQLAISQKQKEVDYIRKHNKRYIKL
tara:strand:- start:1593 stop:2363 length:771 start_codon:yes stop_codon:yes gene_type:complete